MPHIIVKLAAGRSQPLKQELADRLAATLTDVLGVDSSAVSVAVEDVPMRDWMWQVYGPDIETAGERLLKRPGYGPLAVPPEK
ncbi:4-oxalocrotonate tautomerase family protein [Pseudomonas citronellolis]|uniref:4-oxalocrotonate tautomerase family protein n=1 Tax=Pseudomonas citronellolis TaxID=53408 RepID=UPI000853DDCB|nr:4-oxalocrotonate tautomerase family protein [Pseudomonas humi]